eukprot:SAG22_NODE_3755_length_1544_cov_0.891349_3_plen_154_part_01
MFFMAGCSGYLLVIFYTVFDLQLDDGYDATALGGSGSGRRVLVVLQRGLRLAFTPARWVGLNTMFVYLMGPSGGVFFGLQVRCKALSSLVLPLELLRMSKTVPVLVVCLSLQNWLYFNGDPKDTPRNLFYKYTFCQHTEKIDHVMYCTGYGVFN